MSHVADTSFRPLVLRLVITVAVCALAAARAGAVPFEWPSSDQVSCPSISSASPDLLDQAGFPSRAGIEWGERYKPGVNTRSITLDLTPLGMAEALHLVGGPGQDPAVSGPLARAAARVALGGPLQLDSGPRAVRAGRLTNHVTSELKVQLRDPSGVAAGPPTRLALALDAADVATGYGLDRYGVTFIAERPGPYTVTANVGYRIVEKYKAPIRLAETKLGSGIEWHLFADHRHAQVFDVGLAGACLLRNHGRSAVWQGGAHLDTPLTSGFSLGISARHSVHPELPGLDLTRCELSLAYDLGRAKH